MMKQVMTEGNIPRSTVFDARSSQAWRFISLGTVLANDFQLDVRTWSVIGMMSLKKSDEGCFAAHCLVSKIQIVYKMGIYLKCASRNVNCVEMGNFGSRYSFLARDQ